VAGSVGERGTGRDHRGAVGADLLHRRPYRDHRRGGRLGAPAKDPTGRASLVDDRWGGCAGQRVCNCRHHALPVERDLQDPRPVPIRAARTISARSMGGGAGLELGLGHSVPTYRHAHTPAKVSDPLPIGTVLGYVASDSCRDEPGPDPDRSSPLSEPIFHPRSQAVGWGRPRWCSDRALQLLSVLSRHLSTGNPTRSCDSPRRSGVRGLG
jgi:hypothetical protein